MRKLFIEIEMPKEPVDEKNISTAEASVTFRDDENNLSRHEFSGPLVAAAGGMVSALVSGIELLTTAVSGAPDER